MKDVNSKMTAEARTLVQKFVTGNVIDLEGRDSAVPAAMVLAVEAFAVVAAMFAMETNSDIDEALEFTRTGLDSAGVSLAKNCLKATKRMVAEARAERATSEILDSLRK